MVHSRSMGQWVRREGAYLAILLGAVVIWALCLKREALYGGFSPNDSQQHVLYIQQAHAALEAGRLPLDEWGDHCCLGAPTFRSVQYLPHLLSALLMKVGHLTASQSLHLLMVFLWLIQFPCAYYFARSIKLRGEEALLIALMSPLVASPSLGSQSLSTYLFAGYGMFAQVGAAPLLYLLLGRVLQSSGWVEPRPSFSAPESIKVGLLIALLFLTHHYFGYVGLVSFLFLIGLSVLSRSLSLQVALAQVAVASLIFFLVTAHQLKSIWEDLPLIYQNTWDNAGLWGGRGLPETLSGLVNGQLLDHQRIQAFFFFICVTLFSLMQRKAPRALLGTTFLFYLGILGVSGTKGAPILEYLPLFSYFQPARALVLLHITGVILAGYGVSILVRSVRESPTSSAFRRGGMLFVLASLIGYLHLGRLEQVEQSGLKIDAQIPLNQKAVPEFSSLLADPREHSRYWTSRASILRWGNVSLQSILAELGNPHISVAEHSMVYGTETVHLYQYDNSVHSEIFNVSRIFVPTSTKVASPSKFLATRGSIDVYRTENRGLWDVVTIPSVKFARTALEFRDEVSRWLAKPVSREYPSIFPSHFAERWPHSIPAPSSSSVAKGALTVLEPYHQGKAAVRIEGAGVGDYGLFRMSFHPRWRIIRNGEIIFPQWVAPGYVAFPLVPGSNEVSLEFVADPVRKMLFYLGWAVFFGGLIAVSVGLPKKARAFRKIEWGWST